jgi:hypothetical protein
MQLRAEAPRMHHRSNVGHGQILEDAVLSGFGVHFDFGERRE